jgi:hypothetical protein
MRLLDWHLDKVFPSYGKKGLQVRDQFLKLMSIVDITPVARHLLSELEQEEWEVNEFPAPVPPWQHLWLEFDYPTTINSEGKTVTHQAFKRIRHGALVETFTFNEEHQNDVLRRHFLLNFIRESAKTVGQPIDIKTFAQGMYKEEKLADKGTLVKWAVLFMLKFGTQKKIYNMGLLGLHITPDARIIEDAIIAVPAHPSFGGGLTSASFPYLYALSMLNCKNIQLVTQPTSKALRKRARKQNREPIIYKELVVHPMQPRKVQESSEPPQSHNRWHICRGHFKDYRKGKGLFGRIHGLFWVNQHVRGDPNLGYVLKTYKVEKPQ